MITKRERIKNIVKKSLQLFSSNKCARPIFIFGEQRSGTNMLCNTLNKSLGIYSYNETDSDAFDNCVLRDNSCIKGLIKKSRAKCVIFKSISDSQNASIILNQYDNAKGLWIFRSYPDVVNSNLRAFNEHYKYLYYILFDQETAKWRAENVTLENLQLVKKFYEKEIDDASSRALIWYLRNYQYFQQNLQEDERVLLINYENLVKNPSLNFSKIFDFILVPYNASFTKRIFESSIKKNQLPSIDEEIRVLCDDLYEKLLKCTDV